MSDLLQAAAVSARSNVDSYPRIDAVDDESQRPDFSLLVYPAVHGWAANISDDHPPAFFAQAEHDPVDAGNTISYFLTLRTASAAPAALHIFPGDIHGYGLCNTRDDQGRIPCLVAPPEGPGLMPAWRPWSSVCLWPSVASSFLSTIGIISAG